MKAMVKRNSDLLKQKSPASEKSSSSLQDVGIMKKDDFAKKFERESAEKAKKEFVRPSDKDKIAPKRVNFDERKKEDKKKKEESFDSDFDF